MKTILPLFLLFLFFASAGAQCLSGNCENGKGKYDFGWCMYEGQFKNGKANGAGFMKYSDYTYTGTFKNGVEDGDGIFIYTDGRREAVHYINGEKAAGVKKLAAGESPVIVAQDAGCISGDCVNGAGTYQFPSGNKYTGIFKDRKRQGHGIVLFANGDRFEGEFRDNERVSGTYNYASGARYVGTYLAGGQEYNGTITSGSGTTIPFVNGKPVIPPPPPAAKEHYGTCTCCHGRGTIVNASQHNDIGYANGHYGEVFYTLYRDITCNCCHGTGAASDQDPKAKADHYDNNYYRDVIR